MADDLTKLSGPELAAQLTALAARDVTSLESRYVLEAAQRVRGQPVLTAGDSITQHLLDAQLDDRVWQRNLEHERDGLRARVTGLECTCDQLRASCNNQRKELHALNVERRATLTKLEDAQRRVAELEAQLREQVRELEVELGQERTSNRVLVERHRLASKWLDVVEPPWPHAHIDEIARSAARRVAELEAQLREALHGKSYGYPVTTKAEPAERKAQADDAVSTAELSAYEISVADAHGALDVNADGLGFVKREWLDRHRANVQKQRQAMSEPASEPDDPITSWSVGRVLHALDRHMSAEALDSMAAKYLRETLATLDAVRALAEKYKRAALPYDIEAELLEVLNGKR